MKKFYLVAAAISAAAFSMNAAAFNVEAGKAAVQKYNCASCHGADMTTAIDPSYPKLAGQHRDYLVTAMLAYQRGANGANGRGNPIMAAQVKSLSRTEINDIAAYLNSLPGQLVLKK